MLSPSKEQWLGPLHPAVTVLWYKHGLIYNMVCYKWMQPVRNRVYNEIEYSQTYLTSSLFNTEQRQQSSYGLEQPSLPSPASTAPTPPFSSLQLM